MLKYLLLVLMVNTAMPLADQFKRLDAYGETLYNLINEYVQTNSTQNAADVVSYINSDVTKTIFSDAKIAGYTRERVLFQTYQISFGMGVPNEIIITGLHDVLEKEQVVADIAWYGVCTNMGVTSALLLYIIRAAYVYFRFDRPTLNFYRTNDQRWLQVTMSRSAINTNGPFGPPASVPEPIFR